MSRPLASALDSAFFRSCRRNSADLTGQRARETPHCLPIHHVSVSLMLICDDNPVLVRLFSFPSMPQSERAVTLNPQALFPI